MAGSPNSSGRVSPYESYDGLGCDDFETMALRIAEISEAEAREEVREDVPGVLTAIDLSDRPDVLFNHFTGVLDYFKTNNLSAENNYAHALVLKQVPADSPDCAGSFLWRLSFNRAIKTNRPVGPYRDQKAYPHQGSYGVVISSKRRPAEAVKKILFMIRSDEEKPDLFPEAIKEFGLFAAMNPGFKNYRLYLDSNALIKRTPGSQDINIRMTFEKLDGASLEDHLEVLDPDLGQIFVKDLASTGLAMRIGAGIFKDLYQLAQWGYAHLDIKPANVMLTSEYLEEQARSALRAQLIDYGAALHRSDIPGKFDYRPRTTYRDFNARLNYFSCGSGSGDPEQGHGPKVDAWSVGLVLLEPTFRTKL